MVSRVMERGEWKDILVAAFFEVVVPPPLQSPSESPFLGESFLGESFLRESFLGESFRGSLGKDLAEIKTGL